MTNLLETLEIRRAGAGDTEALTTFAAQTFREAFGADNATDDIDAYIRESFSTERVRSELADDRNLFLVAFLQKEAPPIAYAKMRAGTAEASVKGPDPIELQRLYVRKDAIGSGIGAALMQACLDVAWCEGRRTLWLGVWDRNSRAIDFYGRWGFKVVGEHVFQLGSDQQIDLIMERAVQIAGTPAR